MRYYLLILLIPLVFTSQVEERSPVVISCSNADNTGDKYNQGNDSILLSTKRPVSEVLPDTKVLEQGRYTLQVIAKELQPASSGPFSVHVSLTGEEEAVFIGSFTIFPAGSEGKFVFDIRAAAERFKGKPAKLKFELRQPEKSPDVNVLIKSFRIF